jgi:hypothetical protein
MVPLLFLPHVRKRRHARQQINGILIIAGIGRVDAILWRRAGCRSAAALRMVEIMREAWRVFGPERPHRASITNPSPRWAKRIT